MNINCVTCVMIRYRSKNRKLGVRTNLNAELKGDKSTTNNNKAFKQKDELAYHPSVKAHDNVHRESELNY